MITPAYEAFVNDTAMELFGLSKKEKEAKAAKLAADQKEREEFNKKCDLVEKFMNDNSKMNPVIKKLLVQAVPKFNKVAEEIYGGKTSAGKAPKAKDFKKPEIELIDYTETPKISILFRLTDEYCKFLYESDPDKAGSVSSIKNYAWIRFEYDPFANKVTNICQYDS